MSIRDLFLFRDGRHCIDVSVVNPESHHVTEQAAIEFDTNYLCQNEFGTNACEISNYQTGGLEICEGLYCVDPLDTSLCTHAGFIPPHGKDTALHFTAIVACCFKHNKLIFLHSAVIV